MATSAFGPEAVSEQRSHAGHLLVPMRVEQHGCEQVSIFEAVGRQSNDGKCLLAESGEPGWPSAQQCLDECAYAEQALPGQRQVSRLQGGGQRGSVDGSQDGVSDRRGRPGENDVIQAGQPEQFSVLAEPGQTFDLEIHEVGRTQPACGRNLVKQIRRCGVVARGQRRLELADQPPDRPADMPGPDRALLHRLLQQVQRLARPRPGSASSGWTP